MLIGNTLAIFNVKRWGTLPACAALSLFLMNLGAADQTKVLRKEDKALVSIDVSAPNFLAANKKARSELRQALDRLATASELDLVEHSDALEALWRDMTDHLHSYQEKSANHYVFTYWTTWKRWNHVLPGESQASIQESPSPKPPTSRTIDENIFSSGSNLYALIIGNDEYRHFPPLRSAVNDAREVETVLQSSYGYKTVTLLNADRRRILEAFDLFRLRLKPTDQLIVYYGGHGQEDREIERGYWIPVGAKPGTSANWISNADITDRLKGIKANKILVVSDSCYSGTLVRGLHVRATQKGKRLKTRTALTSGGVEPVSDGGGGKLSIFCRAFTQALKNNQDEISGEALFRQIKAQLELDADQTPRYRPIGKSGHQVGGEFYLRKLSGK